jgi:hypothetical protein
VIAGVHGIGLDVFLRSHQPFHPSQPKLLCVWLLTLRFHSVALSTGSGSFPENQISHGSNRGIMSIFIFFISIYFILSANLFVNQLKAKQGKNESIVCSMLQDLKPNVRITNSKEIIIQDIIPFSLPIITPSLRPVRNILIH